MAKTTDEKSRERQLKERQKQAMQKARKPRKSIGRAIKDVWQELKKVTWPSKKDLLNYTVAVIIFIAIMAAITGVIDLGLTNVFNLVIK